MYRNIEHYADPTPGEAIKNIMLRKYHEQITPLKQVRKFMPKVYICSPFAGKIKKNIRNARRYCAFAVEEGYIPYAAHLFFPQFLSDSNPEERKLGLHMGLIYLDGCKECWVFGNVISHGMAAEIKRAKERNITIRYFTEQCEEVPEWIYPKN